MGKGGEMVTERNCTLGSEGTVQCAHGVLLNCTPETHVVLLTNVTLINALKEREGGYL